MEKYPKTECPVTQNSNSERLWFFLLNISLCAWNSSEPNEKTDLLDLGADCGKKNIPILQFFESFSVRDKQGVVCERLLFCLV